MDDIQEKSAEEIVFTYRDTLREAQEKQLRPIAGKPWIYDGAVLENLLAAHLASVHDFAVVSGTSSINICKIENGRYIPMSQSDIDYVILQEIPTKYQTVEALKKTARLLAGIIPKRITEATALNDVFAQFVEMNCEITGLKKSHRIARPEFNNRFKEYCRQMDIIPPSGITTRIKKMGVSTIKSTVLGYAGAVFFTGIRWIEKSEGGGSG